MMDFEARKRLFLSSRRGRKTYKAMKSKPYFSFACCGSETTMKVCHWKTFSTDSWLRSLWGMEEKRAKREDPSLTAIRLKKSRLRKTAFVIVEFHGSRARFLTVTFRFSEELKSKKFMQDKMKYLFKKLKRAGYEIEYSGMLERHLGEKRKDKAGTMAWHFHCLAYRVGGALWRGVPAWDYGRMQEIAVSLDGNIDMRPLRRAREPGGKISEYMAKLEAASAAAYEAKKATGEDYCYTMTSKGCDLPRQKRVYSASLAHEFMQLGNFKKQEGKGYSHYLSADRKFSRTFYENI